MVTVIKQVIKKQEQRLADLKKLLQRELKVLPSGADNVTSTYQPTAAEHAGSNSALRIDIAAAAAAVGVHTSALHHSHSDTAESPSPATLTVSEVGSGRHRNGVADGMSASYGGSTPWPTAGRGDGVTTSSGRTRRTSHRSFNGTSHTPSLGGGVMMSPVDSEYDFMRELNFKYLRHVVLKFMLSREAEVRK